jgi:hypothetical protein
MINPASIFFKLIISAPCSQVRYCTTTVSCMFWWIEQYRW